MDADGVGGGADIAYQNIKRRPSLLSPGCVLQAKTLTSLCIAQSGQCLCFLLDTLT